MSVGHRPCPVLSTWKEGTDMACASCGAHAPWHKAGCKKLLHLLDKLK